MTKAVDNWIAADGRRFLTKIGIKPGQTVLDFGCGEGHYTIPVSELVGNDGMVYAMDKDTNVLNKLKKSIRHIGIKNISFINKHTHIPLKDNSVDVVLCYDVIHYMATKERKIIYREIHKVLRDNGLLSIYPKHHKKNHPLMELANMKLRDVIKEIEDSNFVLEHKFLGKVLHDDYYDEGYVLNFKKGEQHALD